MPDMQEIEDWLSDVISDSLDPEWTSRIAAKHILENLNDAPFAVVPKHDPCNI